jgi:hypothetical protein
MAYCQGHHYRATGEHGKVGPPTSPLGLEAAQRSEIATRPVAPELDDDHIASDTSITFAQLDTFP